MHCHQIKNYILNYNYYQGSKGNTAVIAFLGVITAIALAALGSLALKNGWIHQFHYNTLTSATLSSCSGLGFLLVTTIIAAVYYQKTVVKYHRLTEEGMLLSAFTEEKVDKNSRFSSSLYIFLNQFGKANWKYFLLYIDKICFKNKEITYSEQSRKNVLENLAIADDFLRDYSKELENELSVEFKDFLKKLVPQIPDEEIQSQNDSARENAESRIKDV